MHSHSNNRNSNRKALSISLIITTVIMALEFFGGLITNSLALISDAGHMLSDAGSLALSLTALYLAAKPSSPTKTYGFYRFEILAALINGVALFVIAGYIMWEAYGRLLEPPLVNSPYMIGIAVVGLLANLLSAWMLHSHGDIKDNINLRSAYLHILGDALGSVGAIAAGVVIYYFGWYVADPVISVVVALLILRSAWSVINDAVHILLEGTPPTVDWTEVKDSLAGISGVKDIHDLHIWTITSGKDSISCHLVIEDKVDPQLVLQQAVCILRDKFKIEHSTIQVEAKDFHHPSCRLTSR